MATTATAATTRTGRLRLRDLKPDDVALEAANALIADVQAKASALDPAYEVRSRRPTPALLRESPVYTYALGLARYAIEGTPCDLDAALRYLAVLYTSPLGDEAEVVVAPEPTTAFATVVAGAVARHTLSRRQPLSSPQIALLVGFDRDHVNGLASTGGIPSAYRDERLARSPWRFRVTAALTTWLDERGVR